MMAPDEVLAQLQKLASQYLDERSLGTQSFTKSLTPRRLSRARTSAPFRAWTWEALPSGFAAQRGFPAWWVEFWQAVHPGQGACGTALERGERVIVEDVEKSPIFVGTPALEVQGKVGVRAVQSTPLRSRTGTLLGVLSTHWKTAGRPDDRSLQALDLLGRHAADLIEHVRVAEALRSANTQVIEADARKNQFLAMLSHELRNPLAPIKTSLYVLDRASPGSDQALRAKAVVDRQAAQLARLVDDLLDTDADQSATRFSSIGSGWS